MTSVRFGLVGCGRIGSTADDRVRTWAVADLWLPYAHGSAIAATAGATLAAVCDMDASAATDAMRRHGATASYTDYEEMLARQQLDAVAIATRTRERSAIAHAAIRHGVRGLYCEKPLSNSLEEAEDLVRAVEEAGTTFVYGTKRRFMPLYERVHGRLSAGELGELTTITVRFGYGSLLWSLPHAVDIASFFAGDAGVDRVQADLVLDAASVHGAVVDADPILHAASIRFSNGIRAVLVAGDGMDVQIAGREGLVSIEADGSSIRWRRRLRDGTDIGWLLDERIDPRDTPSSGTQRSIGALVNALNEGVYPGYCIRDALRNQEILFAMVESQLSGGRPVTFPLARRGLIITGRTGTLYA